MTDSKPSQPQEPTQIRIAMVQDNLVVGDTVSNAERIIAQAQSAAARGADIAVFPELALTGYPPEDLLYRDAFIEACEAAVSHVAQSVEGIDVIIGAPTRASGALYNSALWIRDGDIIARYHKQHLPNYSVFDEKRYFDAGDEAVFVEMHGVRFALAICEDIWQQDYDASLDYSEADCLIVINASPFHIGKTAERERVVSNQAIRGAQSVLYLNLVGGQDELVFDGESLACDANGDIVYRGAAFEPASDLITVTADSVRCDLPLPAPRDEVAIVYDALVLGTRDFVRKNGFEGVVIGLSGGVDSALTTAIAVDAFGAENVHTIMMPSMYTADISRSDAQEEAEILGVTYDIIAIEPMVGAVTGSLADVFAGTEPDTTEENIQARLRGLILMAISNKSGRMVLTTGNKSEMAVGYATLYGDMNGGFAPLKDLSKTLVYALCHYRNSIGRVIPERVLTRAPSAELRPDQTDQDSLPDYAVLDSILEMSVEQDMSVEEIVAAGIDRADVERVVSLVKISEYKRRQAAPGIRITRRAFGRDRRYPITSGFRG